MNAQLNAYGKGEQSLANVLVRLLAVLAVLRELRNCDGRVAWVEKGKTTVPNEQRLRLLKEVMFNLFERNALEAGASLLHLEPLGDEFQHSDDIARLKGLILWLAWDCGLTLERRGSLSETRESADERLERNAMVVALAQMIQSDEVVIDEARRSIGGLTVSEMNWLNELRRLAARCESLREDRSAWHPAEKGEPGDIAIHQTLVDWDLRVVARRPDKRISLIRLAKNKNRVAFRSDHLAVVDSGAEPNAADARPPAPGVR
jgi:hypothetical protein